MLHQQLLRRLGDLDGLGITADEGKHGGISVAACCRRASSM
jgi:hypothetical protein